MSPFHRDIAAWARAELISKEARLVQEQASFSSRVQQKRREKVANDITKTREQLVALDRVKKFRYGIGPDLGNGILGHEDVIKMATDFLQTRPLLAKIVARKFPIVFVDESQDTFPEVVAALKHVKRKAGPRFCLGFFGDPMQKVYPRGIGDIALESDWIEIEKPENFRSPLRVLEVMNHIRVDGDGLHQISGRSEDDQVEGIVRYFVLPADERRSENLGVVRRWLDDQTGEGAWTTNDHHRGAKILVIAHRMAARRLEFERLYSAFHDSGSSSLSQAFDEGNAWPMTFLIDAVLPLVEGDPSSQLSHLRRYSPKFGELRRRGTNVRSTLKELQGALAKLRTCFTEGGHGSVGSIIQAVHEGGLLEIDPRLHSHLVPDTESNVVLSESTVSALTSLMTCDVRELLGYRTYLSEESPYATHQGVKGAEFERVIVVLDDEEGQHRQFSYDKLFGLRPPSPTDRQNILESRESVFERTRRLLYVCISRSTSALAVIFYSRDPAQAATAMRQAGLPGADQLMVLNAGGQLTEAD